MLSFGAEFTWLVSRVNRKSSTAQHQLHPGLKSPQRVQMKQEKLPVVFQPQRTVDLT